MTTLATKQCEPCRKDTQPASPEQIRDYLSDLPEWKLIEEEGESRIVRSFAFGDFRQALDLTVAVGELAEAENHHPKITTEWGKTTVRWWTHKIGGLHETDFIMAARTDRAYEGSRTSSKP